LKPQPPAIMSHHTTTTTTPAVHTATDATLSDKTSTASPTTTAATPAASPAPVSSGGDIGVCDDTSPNDEPVAYLDFETMGLPDQLLRGKLSYPSFRPGQPTFPRALSSYPPTQHTAHLRHPSTTTIFLLSTLCLRVTTDDHDLLWLAVLLSWYALPFTHSPPMHSTTQPPYNHPLTNAHHTRNHDPTTFSARHLRTRLRVPVGDPAAGHRPCL
jgi:hypothetical protein